MHRGSGFIRLCVSDDVVRLLCEYVVGRADSDVITIAHVVEPAYNTIGQNCFVSHSVAIHEERVPTLLIVGNHSRANLALHHCSRLV